MPQTAVLSGDKGKITCSSSVPMARPPKPVQTGDWQGKDWIILGGLQGRRRIIVDNLMKVRPSAPVKSRALPLAPNRPGKA